MRSTSRGRWLLGLLLRVAVLAGVIAMTIGSERGSEDAPDATTTGRVVQGGPSVAVGQLSLPTVGERVTLDQAVSQADFPVRVPDTATANPDNMTRVLTAGDSVQMDFPPPNDHSSDLRQPYLSVWEAPWTEGDPMANYKDDIANDPDAGSKSICSVNDLPALCVEARSPADDTQQNPAFLRVIIEKVEVEVSGGDSVNTLIDVATSVTKGAPSQQTSGQ